MNGGLIATAIRRPVTVLVGVLMVWLAGALTIDDLPIQLTPDISIPVLEVQTRWPGAAPLEIEREIVEPQEEVLSSLRGLVRMTSESQQDRGTITLELKVGTQLDEAIVRVANQLTQVPQLPENAREPVISTADSAGPPLAVLVLRRRDGSPMDAFRTWGEQELVPAFERIPGIAAVQYFGGRDNQLHVEIDPAALAARGLTLEQVSTAVRAELRDVSAGDIDLGKQRFVVRTQLTPEDPSELDRIVLAIGEDGQPIRLGDVGSVRVALAKQTSFVMSDGQETLAMLLGREAGANVLAVTQAIRARVAEVQTDLLDERGIELQIASDQTGYINGALDLVRQNLVFGAILAIGVLWAFLGSWRAAALVGLAIPTCVMGTIAGMSWMGRSVNVVSLAGMAFAVGMVVDNAIVVIEAIVAARADGRPPAEAARQGATRVWGAIVASTATTAAVFLPILGWQGEVGQLLRDVAVAIVVAVCLSLVVSVLVIPTFAARLTEETRETPGPITAWGVRAKAAIVGLVRRVVSHTGSSLVVTVGAITSTALLAFMLLPPMEYLPEGNRPMLFGVIVPPPGYSVNEMRRVGKHIQDRLLPHAGVELDGVPPMGRTFFVGSPGSGFMGATAEDPDRVGELVSFVRQVQAEIPGVFGFAFQASLFGRTIGSGRAVDIEISGPDLAAVRAVGGQLMGQLQVAVPGAQVRPIPGLDAGGPELRITPQREVASELGLSGSAIGQAIDVFVDGRRIGEYGDEGEPKLDVVLRATTPATTPADIQAMPISTPSGRVVPLAAVTTMIETISPLTIRHIERRRAITLQLTPPKEVELEAAMAAIESQVLTPYRQTAAPGVRIDVAGAADDLADAQRKMAGVLGLAVLIAYLLMAALFEDVVAPLAILASVPLATAGGLGGLRLVDALLAPQALDVMTAVGFVILIGVVVNNPILVVDGAMSRLREGANLVDAIAGGVDDRVRPIVMTTLTTLAGLTPLVVVSGQGSELYRGVGAVVLGGLTLATILTLIVVPAALSLLLRMRGQP